MQKEKILDYIRTGDTGEAINLLLDELVSSVGASAGALKAVRLIQAEYNRLREEQIQNTIDAAAAEARLNAINKRLLDILDTPVALQQPPTGKKAVRIGIISGGVLLLAFLAWKVIPWETPPIPPPSHQEEPAQPLFACPAFDANYQLKITLLPFLNLSSKEDVAIHFGLQDEINALLRQLMYPGQAKVASGDPEKNYLTFEDAEILRGQCDADMVVWGKYSSQGVTEDELLDVRFVSPPFDFPQKEEVDSLLEHRSQEELSANLKTTAKLLLAQAFLSENRMDIALQLAQEVIQASASAPAGDAARTDAHIIAAEAYQMLDQPEKAAASYEEVLKNEPDNKTALTNLPVLDFKAKKFTNAEWRTERALKINPEKIGFNLLQAEIFKEQGETLKAREALSNFRTEVRQRMLSDTAKISN